MFIHDAIPAASWSPRRCGVRPFGSSPTDPPLPPAQAEGRRRQGGLVLSAGPWTQAGGIIVVQGLGHERLPFSTMDEAINDMAGAREAWGRVRGPRTFPIGVVTYPSLQPWSSCAAAPFPRLASPRPAPPYL